MNLVQSSRYGLLGSPRVVVTLGAVAASVIVALTVATRAPANPERPGVSDLTAVVNEKMGLVRSNVVPLELDPIPGRAVLVTIPVDGQLVTLDLMPHSIRSEHYRVRIQIDDGSLIEVDPDPVRTLRGTVIEHPGSVVAASLEQDGLHASIMLAEGEHFWVEPIINHVPGARADQHVVYNAADALCGGACGVNAMQQHAEIWRGGEEGMPLGTVCKVALLGVDADFQYYQALGSSVSNVQSNINAIINNVNAQYSSQCGIIHQISEIVVRTSSASNPYTTNDSSQLLNQFRNVWRTSPESSIPRAMAHLFTGRNLNGSTIGVAWLASVCDSIHGYHYGLSQRQTNFGCMTDLVAHEMGHNWSAQHCSCPSHTMNPSLTCANSHNTVSINQIVNFRNSISCLTNCIEPPANNTCAGTIVIPEGSTLFDNIDATTDGPAETANCTFGGDGQIQSDVWFGHLVQCTGNLTISLCGSSFATKIAVYDFPCPTQPGTVIACDTFSCPTNTRSQVTIPVVAGQALRIRVGGHNGAQGQGVLAIECEPVAPVCPEDLNGDGVVDVSDLLGMLADWGTCAGCSADINGDGVVDVSDLLVLLGAWGDC